jgi:glycine dehydrogenase subunit 2
MNERAEALIFELSSPGRTAVSLPDIEVPETSIPKHFLRQELPLPEVDELSLVRHFTKLSRKNYSIDGEFYPLGSCTMKYNPKACERAAGLPGFLETHPLLPEAHCQGSLELIYGLQEYIREVGGFAAASLQPAAGAQGELAGVLMMRAYHLSRGNSKRTKVLIPDSAHGTNPASCTMAGMEAATIPSDASGGVDMEALHAALDETTAGLMITNPGTLGLFERNIEKIVRMVHEAGGLVYGDGANMNALVGIFRPGDSGFDVMHFNLHKTFSTPHGGGGPGAGAVGASLALADFLPGPIAEFREGRYAWRTPARSIGRIKAFHGNFGILSRAWTYIRMLGAPGLRRVAENAVLNANYLRVLLGERFIIPYNRVCMHEFVAEGDIAEGIRTLDVAKRLIDYGFHPPTIYFPLIVHEAMMVEPTETESRESLEAFANAMADIADEARTNPALLLEAPHETPVGRLDEVGAARNPVLCYKG